MTAWLTRYWVAAALLMGIVLLLLIPVLAATWTLPLIAIFLQLPIYMLHQVEEHTGDRFRSFVNNQVFGGVEALTPASILWINLPGVWGVNLASLYAAQFVGTGWGLAGIYLTLVNTVVHIAGAVAKRAYNPGLWTSLALFIPAGGWALSVLDAEPQVNREHHIFGLSAAVVIHVAIIAYAQFRIRSIAQRR